MKLILNRRAREGERFIDANATPTEIEAALEAILRERVDVDVCSFSPLVASRWMYGFRHDFPDGYDTVFVFDGERDWPVTDFAAIEWLARFDLGEMYMRREFETEIAVSGKNSADGGVPSP